MSRAGQLAGRRKHRPFRPRAAARRPAGRPGGGRRCDQGGRNRRYCHARRFLLDAAFRSSSPAAIITPIFDQAFRLFWRSRMPRCCWRAPRRRTRAGRRADEKLPPAARRVAEALLGVHRGRSGEAEIRDRDRRRVCTVSEAEALRTARLRPDGRGRDRRGRSARSTAMRLPDDRVPIAARCSSSPPGAIDPRRTLCAPACGPAAT